MIPVISPKKIKNVEKNYLINFKNKEILQKRAVKGIAKIIIKQKPSVVIIFFGPGMNGNDGLKVGKLISKEIGSKNVNLISCINSSSSNINLDFAKDEGFEIQKFDKKFLTEKSKSTVKKIIVIDSILGISAKGSLRKDLSEKIKFLNKIFYRKKNIKIYSLDIPTGFDPNNGNIDKNTLKSDEIIMLGSQVISSVINPEIFKKISYVDLGFKKDNLNSSSVIYEALTPAIAKKNFTQRSEISYKNRFGSHLIIGGSENYPGAALLCSRSSNISGTGHTSIYTSEKIIEKIIKKTPETTFFKSSFSDQNSFEKYTSISIGVGLGQNKYSKKIIFEFLEYIQSTKNIHNIIIDADALNILSTINYWWEKLPISTLITPHIGEFNRIYKFKNYDNIFEKVTNFSKLTKLCLLLKGPTTFISQNSELIINTAPNGGMSKPGMGDVLTGLIGGLASLPKIKVKDAAIIGTYVHSNAGKLARKFKGSTSMTASDVISFIPQVFKNLEE